MFTLIFGLFSTYMQLMYLVAGATCSGIGLLILAYAVYVRLRERSYRGEIVADRKEGSGQAMYWPVVAYSDEHGQRHEAVANSRSSLLSGQVPGTRVTLFADPAKPDSPMLARDWWLLSAAGAIVLAVGYPFIHLGLKGLHFNWTTALVAAGISVYLAARIFRFVHPLLDARKSWKLNAAPYVSLRDKQEQRQNLPIVTDNEIAAAKLAHAKWISSARPVAMVLGLALFAGGGFWFAHQISFLHAAVTTLGEVVRNDTTQDNGSYSYHAVVLFTDRDGRRILYRDPVGTSPPWYGEGDRVKVLYLAREPSRIMLDRGVWNWLVSVLVASAGALLFAAGLYGYAARRGTEAPPVAATATE